MNEQASPPLSPLAGVGVGGGGGAGSREADAEEESQARDGEERERMKESFHGIWTDIHRLLISIFTCEALPRFIRVRGRARALFRIIIHAHISLSAQKRVKTDLNGHSLHLMLIRFSA